MLEAWQEAIALLLLLLLELVRLRARRNWGFRGPLFSLPPPAREDEVPTDPGPRRRGMRTCGVCEGRGVAWNSERDVVEDCYFCHGKGRIP